MKFKFINQFHIYSFLLCCILAAYFLFHGNLNSLFQVGNLTSAYDSLARNLTNLQLGVDPQYIVGEGFTREGNTYMYFGVTPAIMRIPLISLLPQSFGLWNGLSRLLAYVICLLVMTKISHFALQNNENLQLKEKQSLLVLSIFGFGLGSMLYHLTTFMSTFYEAIIWALAFSVIAIYQLLKYLHHKESKYLVGLSIFACLAFLSKVTFGFGLLVILFLIILKDISEIEIKIIPILIPIILTFSMQAWINNTRFGDAFTFCDYKIYDKWLKYKKNKPEIYKHRTSIRILDTSRIAKNFKSYFEVRKYTFINHFPYFKPVYPYFYKGPFAENYEEGSQVFPFSAAYTWLFLALILGSIVIFKRKDISLEFIFLVLFLEAFSIFCYKAINQRYLAELMPLSCFCFYYFLNDLKSRKFAIPIKTLIVLYSITATTCVAIYWRAHNPYSQQARIKKQAQGFINKTNNNIKKIFEAKTRKE